MTTIVLACADDPPIRGADGAKPVDRLCHEPTQVAEHAADADRLVLLLHEGVYGLSSVQHALRAIDIDPLGAQILDVPPDVDGDSVLQATLGLRSRTEAFTGSSPEHIKPTFPRTLTRRDLLRSPTPEYMAAPMIDHKTCRAEDGCRACVDVCPQDAYQWQQGRIHYNKDICEPCGRCVTKCPTAAISNPAVTPAMLKAQVTALVASAETPIGIRFVCSRRVNPVLSPGWHDIEVPCTGMVPGTWLLACALLGAGSVVSQPCTAGGCPLGLDQHSLRAIDLAREALIQVGFNPVTVPASVEDVATPIGRIDLKDPFGRDGPVEVFLALSHMADATPTFSHRGAGIGVVEIDRSACTLCTQCATTCPTGALGTSFEGETVSLTFDTSLCTDCRQCILACPEIEHDAIAVEGRVDFGRLTAGRQLVNEGTVLLCESCRQPIAPAPMMDRIGELLGDEFSETMEYLVRRCIDCRGLS